jgi:primosomal protein N' (replication factor Y)
VGEGYDYLAPEGLEAPDGSFVTVPLGRKYATGVVWGEGTGKIDPKKLKPIGEVLDAMPLPKSTRKFVDWMASYTLSPPGAILKMVMGANWRLLGAKDKIAPPSPNPQAEQPTLSPSQEEAATNLRQAVARQSFSVTLLDGITGSGKTEVYAEAMAEAFRQGRQVLVLLPEIAMTAAMIGRLTRRFGAPPVEWHSELSMKQRRLNWHAIAQGKARFILGARSALMLPYANLGLIVVDEEHEAAYKQEEGVVYHGRDMAVARGKAENCPVILSSATPSLETLFNVRSGKYGHAVLRERFGGAKLPSIQLVDIRAEDMPAQNFITAPLLKALEEKIATGQQAMLFLNRRGYAPLTLCRACGHRLQCPNCSSWLIQHKKTARLHCHHCDYSMALPASCPTCHAVGKFAACGPGIERIQEELSARLPQARSAIMASDTLSGPKEAAELIRKMENRDIDVLIGTQIMAKGYHFPRLTLVGVIDADIGLGGGDPRAAEHTFQLLQQVAGRSGRANEAGQVFLQTASPDHPVMKAMAKGDTDAFFATEMNERQTYRLPPFSRLAAITVTGADLKQVIAAIKEVASKAPRDKRLRLLGPAPAPFAFLRGKHRHRLLVQADRQTALSPVLRAWLSPIQLPRALRLQVDIDPYNFL